MAEASPDHPDIDRDHFIRTYNATRDAYFEERTSPAHSEIPGQLELTER